MQCNVRGGELGRARVRGGQLGGTRVRGEEPGGVRVRGRGAGGWRDQRWFQAMFGPPPQCSLETYN